MLISMLVDWSLYGQVLGALVLLLNRLGRQFWARVEAEHLDDPLPPLFMNARSSEYVIPLYELRR